jgi:hypothetical protein
MRAFDWRPINPAPFLAFSSVALRTLASTAKPLAVITRLAKVEVNETDSVCQKLTFRLAPEHFEAGLAQ